MLTWFARFFGWGQSKTSNNNNPQEAIRTKEVHRYSTQPDPEAAARLDSEAAGFLLSLLNNEEHSLDLHDLSTHDREFISSNLRRLLRKEFEIPLLPDATIRIQQLLTNPEACISELADIFKKDPTLSAELLRLANSSYLVYVHPTLDLQQAIIRVGLNQLNGLVVMFSLRSRILHNRRYQREVAWATNLSLAMAKVCQMLAQELNMPPEEAFTLGLMHHIEYLVVLGEAGKYTVAHRGLPVSRSAIAESIRRVGMQLHSLIAQSWGISSFEKYYHAASSETENTGDVLDIPRRLDLLQRILIEVMSGRDPEFTLDGFDSEKLKKSVETVTGKTVR